MNHHKLDISGDCTTIVTHWVHSIAIIFPHLLAKILNYALQESKIKKVRFNFPGTLQKTIDLYWGGDETRVPKTYVRKSKPNKSIEEEPLGNKIFVDSYEQEDLSSGGIVGDSSRLGGMCSVPEYSPSILLPLDEILLCFAYYFEIIVCFTYWLLKWFNDVMVQILNWIYGSTAYKKIFMHR